MSETNNDPVTQYKLQLAAVEESLKHASASERATLLDLKEKLTEVIILLNSNQEEKSDTVNNEPQTDVSSGSIDDEFLKFQQEISALEGSNDTSGDTKDAHEDDVDRVHFELYKVLSSMEGKKCRAPFARQWGERAYHNAIIFSTDLEDQDVEDINNVQVKVMFCNPLCDEMKPCPFFLDGHCKFEADKCRFSHGNSVKYSDLEEYFLPDYSNVQRDSKCLAKYKDGLWYMAVVENCLEGNKYVIKYDTCGSTDTLAAYDILPMGDLNLSDDDSDSSSDSSLNGYSEEIQSTATVSESVNGPSEINYAAEIGSSAMGTWEKHTKGIASKLMAKMGYVWGQGLGKNSDGRLEPVEAIVFPKGKSIDKCVELRDISGAVSVEEKFAAEQIKEEKRAEKIERNSEPENTVFDFLNKNIARSTDSSQIFFRKRTSSEKISGPERKSQNTDLNFEMYSVGEDIKKTKKEILRLQQSLNRTFVNRNGPACAHMKQQMAVQSSLLKRLEAKEQRISDEINLRKGHKKMVLF